MRGRKTQTTRTEKEQAVRKSLLVRKREKLKLRMETNTVDRVDITTPQECKNTLEINIILNVLPPQELL